MTRIKNGIVWIKPPAGLQTAIAQYGKRAIVAVRAVADYIAQKIQDDARRNAPWHDRTGNARSGLFAVTDAEGAASDIVAIYLSHGHTVVYGKFLELSRAGKYAVILPTIERNLPELQRMLDSLFR